MKLCQQCNINETPSTLHRFCPACLEMRQAAARADYELRNKRKPRQKANVITMQEEKEFRKKLIVDAKYQPKEAKSLMTDVEQWEINKRCAQKTLNMALVDPAIRHRVQQASWLWRAA
jgi:hypothetical protein